MRSLSTDFFKIDGPDDRSNDKVGENESENPEFLELRNKKKKKREEKRRAIWKMGQKYDWLAGTCDPNYTPGRIFWTMIFYNLKNLVQELSNEGSIFILSSVEVGHWVAQT